MEQSTQDQALALHYAVKNCSRMEQERLDAAGNWRTSARSRVRGASAHDPRASMAVDGGDQVHNALIRVS